MATKDKNKVPDTVTQFNPDGSVTHKIGDNPQQTFTSEQWKAFNNAQMGRGGYDLNDPVISNAVEQQQIKDLQLSKGINQEKLSDLNNLTSQIDRKKVIQQPIQQQNPNISQGQQVLTDEVGNKKVVPSSVPLVNNQNFNTQSGLKGTLPPIS